MDMNFSNATFSKFPETSASIFKKSKSIAEEYKLNEVHPECLLLAIYKVNEDDNMARSILVNSGITSEKIKSIIRKIEEEHNEDKEDITLNYISKIALKFAIDSVPNSKKTVKPEHILLGISKIDGGNAVNLLKEHNVTVKSIINILADKNK